jgi:hypothetical protein
MIDNLGLSCKHPPPRDLQSPGTYRVLKEKQDTTSDQPRLPWPIQPPGRRCCPICRERTQRSCVLVRITLDNIEPFVMPKQRRTWQGHEYPRNPSPEQAIVPVEPGPDGSRRRFALCPLRGDRPHPVGLGNGSRGLPKHRALRTGGAKQPGGRALTEAAKRCARLARRAPRRAPVRASKTSSPGSGPPGRAAQVRRYIPGSLASDVGGRASGRHETCSCSLL